MNEEAFQIILGLKQHEDTEGPCSNQGLLLVNDWLTDWMNEKMHERVHEWMNDRMNEWMNEQVNF